MDWQDAPHAAERDAAQHAFALHEPHVAARACFLPARGVEERALTHVAAPVAAKAQDDIRAAVRASEVARASPDARQGRAGSPSSVSRPEVQDGILFSVCLPAAQDATHFAAPEAAVTRDGAPGAPRGLAFPMAKVSILVASLVDSVPAGSGSAHSCIPAMAATAP